MRSNHFDEHLSYDKNGNITTLQRTGNVDGFDQIIDDLTYDYIGNQLQKVTDAPIANAHFGFKDGTNTDNDYSYDVFGNMTKDQNKNIAEIKYNHLNLPIKITFVNGNFITYLYDAMGVKVNKYVQGTSGSTSTASSTDYLTGFQYNNQILQFFPHAEGYVHVLKGGSDISSFMFDYVYQYKDHLGNIRVSFVADKSNYTNNFDQSVPLKITTENHYYPFGLQHTYNFSKYEPMLEIKNGIATKKIIQVPNSGYQYKYNGKEWQDELGLNMYAMDMRQYDPAIARWVVQDPVVHHNFSPYSAFDNNPVYWADPSGADSKSYNEWFKEHIEWVNRVRAEGDALENGATFSQVYGIDAAANGGDKPKKRKEGPLTEEESKIRPPFTIPSEKETTVNIDDIDPLQLHREEAITLEEWVKKYGSWAQEKIALENGKDKFGLPNGPNLNYRYVINPYDNNVMDMRHVVVVGYAMGTINGLGAEIIQGLAGLVGRDPTNSAFNSQDKYSNSIGAYFFDYDFRQNGLGMSYNFGNRFNEFLKAVYKK